MRQRRERGQVMLIILGTLLLGGGLATGFLSTGKSVKAMRKEIAGMPLEEERRDRVDAVLDRWEVISGPAVGDFEAYGQALIDLIARQSASRADFQQVLERQRGQVRAAEDALMPIRRELREVLEPAEWKELFD